MGGSRAPLKPGSGRSARGRYPPKTGAAPMLLPILARTQPRFPERPVRVVVPFSAGRLIDPGQRRTGWLSP